MKYLLVLFIFWILNSTALAEYRYFYDGNGNLAGSANSFGKQTYYYGPNGEDAGSSMRAGNNTFYYDQNGNSIGNSVTIPSIKIEE